MLFATLIEEFRNRIITELDAYTEEDSTPEVRLRRYAKSLLSINMRPQLIALNRVALSEAVAAGAVKPIPTAEDPFMSRFAKLVKEAQVEGVVMEGDALFFAEQLLYATSMNPLISTMLGESRFADPVEQQRYFDQAWKLFMNGAKPRGKSDGTSVNDH